MRESIYLSDSLRRAETGEADPETAAQLARLAELQARRVDDDALLAYSAENPPDLGGANVPLNALMDQARWK